MKILGFKRVAARYVRALFDVAQSAKAVDAVEADLRALAAALAESAEFRHFLGNPLLSTDMRAKAMIAILDKIRVHQVTRQFIGMLIRQKRLEILPSVAETFIDWAAAARGEMKAELISATQMKAKEIAQLSEKLTKVYGRKVNVEVRQNPALLGGVILKIGSVQLDSSLAGKLDRLSIKLKAA